MKEYQTTSKSFLDFLKHWIFILILAYVIVCARNIEGWLTKDLAYNYGTLLTGVAAFVALLLAPHELWKWRKRERTKKTAETAGKGLVSISRFIEALQFITNPMWRPSEKNQEDNSDSVYLIRNNFSKRYEQSEMQFNSFLEAWYEAEVYLPKEVLDLFNSIWQHWHSVQVDFELYCFNLEQGEADILRTPEHRKVQANVYGGGREKYEEFRKQAIALLQPIARYQE